MLSKLVVCLVTVGAVLSTGAGAEQPGLLGHGEFDAGQGDIAVDSAGRGSDGEIWGAEWVRRPFGTAAGWVAAAPQGTAASQEVPRRSQLASALARYETRFALLAVSPLGRCVALIDKARGEDRIARSTPLVSIKLKGETHKPSACGRDGDTLIFRFVQARTTVALRVEAKPQYFVFKVESVSNPDVEEIALAEFALKPCAYVSAMSGLAADERFGVCLRTLNLQTYVRVGGREPVLRATVSKEHGLTDGRAALVAAPVGQLRPALQRLVQAEGVVHSKLGGPFALDAPQNRGSYVFARVAEKDVDRWIELARRGGISTIHLNGWYRSLGHYEPREDLYPKGIESLKRVVDHFHAAGLKVGIHTLTGCISPHDPWVRPVPDRRLATDGTFTLGVDIDERTAEVPTLEPPGKLPTVWAYGSRGNCIRIDDELILYSKISNESPTGFFKCQRGAFGTKAGRHKKGTPVYHMYVRYGCFVPDEDSTLVDEVADRIADVFNTCHLDQIYMDGAEAMRGWYGIARMRQAIFKRLRRPALVEASCWDHHSWPFHSRVGAWDHPRWGLKRFADTHVRAAEAYRRAFLLEAQLGWWVILGPSRDWDAERLDEIEYLCAKALAHDAPLSFQTVAATGRPANARQDEYLTLVGWYERLRLADYFNDQVKEQLKAERRDFRLEQADDGQWQFRPTDYLQHEVAAQDEEGGSSTWTVENRFGPQPLKLRIHALYAAHPYEDEESVVLAEFSRPGEFEPAGAGPRVRGRLEGVGEDAPDPPPGTRAGSIARFTATNDGDSPLGAWARAVKTFEPPIDLSRFDALGLWVHGDGKGELLNVQVTNLPEYFRTISDHYIKIDFEGWRYFELLFRERDAGAYHDYKWPYGAHTPLHRSPLVRHVVNKLTLYLNNVPPGEEVTCYLGPIKALRVREVVLRNPTIELNGQRVTFPVELASGMAIEIESADDCRLYDARGELIGWVRPRGDLPQLRPGENSVRFTCQGPEGLRTRAEVTLVATGEPIRGRNPKDRIDWSMLRRQYEPPRTILAIDGRQNRWQVRCHPDLGTACIEMELKVEQVGHKLEAFESPEAVTLEPFETDAIESGGRRSADVGGSFTYDEQAAAAGCLKGVTQQLTLDAEVVKAGRTAARYTATSTRSDNGGWSVQYRRLEKPLDVTRYAAVGFWLCGDGKGESLKLQLRDAAGGWQDMVTRVDFTGWRYCQFDLGAATLKDPSKIVSLNIYYNGIPANATVTCYIDEIRLLPPPRPLRDPELTVDGHTIRFPVELHRGDRLVLEAPAGPCAVYRDSGGRTDVKPIGRLLRLGPGTHWVQFSLPQDTGRPFRVTVSLRLSYAYASDASR
ncbi:MAG TPA: hypothetical protein EYP56_06295 [Planctomycetaceae bacterium]|nr:hypothetical protein [Planctomycetaceae bacterium]